MLLTDAQKWRWVQLNMLAKKLRAGGAFIRAGHSLTIKEIAWELHLDENILQADLEAIKEIGLIAENGHGHYLTRFKKEQEVPKTDAERKADQRERDTEKERTSHNIVTPCDTESELESESDKESESEEESELESEPTKPTDDANSQSDLKAFICSKGDVPSKYSRTIIENAEISTERLLAEIARNYARQGNGKGLVKFPGLITGMNLCDPAEKTPEEWFDHSNWGSLPEPIKKRLGIVIQRQDDDLKNYVGVATRKELRGSEVSKRVRKFFGGDV